MQKEKGFASLVLSAFLWVLFHLHVLALAACAMYLNGRISPFYNLQ